MGGTRFRIKEEALEAANSMEVFFVLDFTYPVIRTLRVEINKLTSGPIFSGVRELATRITGPYECSNQNTIFISDQQPLDINFPRCMGWRLGLQIPIRPTAP